MSMKKNKRTAGFTLIETLVAISILTLAVAGPLTTASRALVAAEISRDQLTASYIAQQGLEHMRMWRDDVYLAAYRAGGANISTAGWANFLSGAGSIGACQNSTCSFNPDTTVNQMGVGAGQALSTCAGACSPLYLYNGMYTQNAAGTRTPFTATITFSPLSSTEEKIVSTVSWSFHGVPYSVSITDHLTQWQ
jgi:prepilin-type N-terminal cleavage/methylation domain-containing protein